MTFRGRVWAAQLEDVVRFTTTVVLSGVLSNRHFEDLLQCLTSKKPRQETDSKPKPRVGWSDGRRQFGSVAAAVVAVLAQADGEIKAKAVHSRVENLLGGPVSRYSVSDVLVKRSKGPNALFVQSRRGYYSRA